MRASLRAALTAVVASGLVASGLVASAGPAWAAPTTEVIQGSVLRLVSTADWEAASSLTAGDPVRWDITVSAEAPDPGRIDLGLSAIGDAPLLVDVSLCAQAWQRDGCPGGERILRSAWEIPRDGAEAHLADMADTDVAHVRLNVALAEGEHAGSTSVRFHARGAGDSATIGPDGPLATTGLSSAVPWNAVGGAALLILGALLLGLRAMRTRRDAAGRGAGVHTEGES